MTDYWTKCAQEEITLNPKGAMGKQIKVTKRMVSAGLKILRESHALAIELSSDDLLVREILEAAFRSRTARRKKGMN